MRSILGWAAALMLIVASLTSCGDGHEAAPTTSVAGPAVFRWQPEAGQTIGASGTAIRSLGIVDGQNGVLYFQGHPSAGAGVYSLWSFDETTRETKELAPDCYGMVNATDEAVYYITHGGGIRRYTLASGEVENVYHGSVSALLATEGHLYFVDSDRVLYQMGLSGGDVVKVWDYVEPHYLECVDGYVYFAQLKPDPMNCDVYRIPVGSPRDVASVCAGIPSPLQYLDGQMLYGDGDGVHLRDLSTGEPVTVVADGGWSGGGDGNAVFYVRGAMGQLELCAYDTESRNTFGLVPVQCSAPYIIDGGLYLVDPIDSLNIQRVVLDAGEPHVEWIVHTPGFDGRPH